MDLNSQQGGKEEIQGPPSNREGGEYIHYGPEPQPQSPQKWGWARTGLEPEARIRVNLIRVLSLIDTSSSGSLIDITLCRFSDLPICPFSVPHFFVSGLEGEYMAIGKGPILGWVEVDLCVPHLICMPAKILGNRYSSS